MWRPEYFYTFILHLYLQIFNDINVKNRWQSVRCKYQLKQITKTREKNVATNENWILIKMGLKFQNHSFNIDIHDRIELSYSASIIRSQLDKHASPLHKMAIEMGQPVLGLHVFRNLAEEKIYMAAVNMLKRGPIICANS